MLFVVAVILVIAGLVQLLQGQILLGILLLIAATVVGPSGYSAFTRRQA